MKKAIVFLLAVVFTATVAAQSGRRNDRDMSHRGNDDHAGVWNKNDRSWDNKGRNNSYEFTAMERDRAIRAVNYRYDRRIEEVRRQRFVRTAVKNREIRLLEKERAAEIREIHQRYQRSNSRNYDKRSRW